MTRGARKSWMADLAPAKTTAKTPAKTTARTTARTTAPASRTDALHGKAPRAPVSGLGLTSARLREAMVARLEAAGIRDARVLAAMARIPRHAFVDEGLASRAYEDSALPIGFEQTISQPFIVALMTETVCAGAAGGRILEVGTGCGYQAAVLAAVAREVYSIERIRALHDRARQNLRPLRLANVRLVFGDGLLGLPEAAPFDGMLIAAAGVELPMALLSQLRVGGIAIAPLGRERQSLCRITRMDESQFQTEALEEVRFVPLLPGLG